MTRHVAIAFVVLATGLQAPEAHADKWILGAEMGAAVTSEQNDRVDAGGVFGLVVGRSFALGPSWEISLQVDVPMPPGLSLQAPITARFWPGSSGFTLHGAVRPIFFSVGVCANDTDQCPMDDSLEPRDRGGFALGVLGGAGAGYAKGRLYGEVSILAGWAKGLERDDGGERPRTGFYRGILFSFGARL